MNFLDEIFGDNIFSHRQIKPRHVVPPGWIATSEVDESFQPGLMASYSAQNVLVARHNFPDAVPPGTELHSVYSDRLQYEFRDEMIALHRDLGFYNDIYVQNLSPTNLPVLEFCTRIAALTGMQKVDGCRIVRFTDGAGYAVYRFDFHSLPTGVTL